jgi:integral membrane protein
LAVIVEKRDIMFKKYFGTTIQALRILALWEPLKYMAGIPEPNLVVGMGHGFLFIGYITIVILARSEYRMSLGQTFWSLLASIVPFGTFVADSRIFKPIQQQVQNG